MQGMIQVLLDELKSIHAFGRIVSIDEQLHTHAKKKINF